jgi:HSP20 family protein
MTKKKLVPVLIVISMFLLTGVIVVSATLNEQPSDNIGISPKTVAIDNVPATSRISDKSVHSGSIYDRIMQSQDRMNERMSKFFNDPYFSVPQHISPSLSDMGSGYPKSRLLKKDKEYILQFIIPGMDKEDIAVELHGNILTVSAKNSSEAVNKNNNNQSYQNISSAFSQSFTIPLDVDVAKITSNYKNGVLTIDLPKDATKASQKTIKIPVT